MLGLAPVLLAVANLPSSNCDGEPVSDGVQTAVLIVVTDTMPLRPGAPDNITVLSTAGTFADSIRRIFTDDSVSEIFAGENQLF